MPYSVKQIPGHTTHRLGGGLIEVIIKEKAPGTGQKSFKVDHNRLISILHSHNLIPPSHNEMFSSMLSSPDILKKLKDSFVYLRRMASLASLPNGFYLLEEGQEPGQFKTDQVTPGTADPEKTVRIWKGKNPPALFILTNEATAKQNFRFMIDMAISPSFSTSTIIGVEPNPLMVLRRGQENIFPSLTPEVITAYRTAIAELNRIEQKLPNSTKNTRELLAALTRLNEWF
jgi:hypothetical protein